MASSVNVSNVPYSTGGQSMQYSSQTGQYSSGQAGAMSYQTPINGGYTTNVQTTTSSTSGGGFQLTGQERVESTRQVSSTIIHEEYMGALPQLEEVRYVEVPYMEEVIKTIPRKEIVEVEKRVPRYEYEWVERIVEIPQIQYVEKMVEVPQYQEVIRQVAKVQVVDVPKEYIRHVPKVEYKQVEKVVEVPGQIIEVPKPYRVENPVPVNRYADKEVAMVVAQSVKPMLVESNDYVDVDVMAYEPECVPVDVHVMKPVSAQIVAGGATETFHKLVTVPAAQYNSMLRSLNMHLVEVELAKLPYMTEGNGYTPFLAEGQVIMGSAPLPGVVIVDQFGTKINPTRFQQLKQAIQKVTNTMQQRY